MRKKLRKSRTGMSLAQSTWPRWAKSLFIAAATALALAALVATPAFAVKIHPFLSSFPAPGKEPSPISVAVNETTHHVYVAIAHGANDPGSINEFEANGTPVAAHPELTGAPAGFNPSGLGVDNSGGAHNGYIYATDVRPGSLFSLGVLQFDPGGTATSLQINSSAIPPNGTPQGGGLPNVVNNGEFRPRSVDIDEAGNIYVSDDSNEAVDEFSPSGAFIAQIGAGKVNATSIAVGPSGELYFANGQEGPIELDSSGECVNSCLPLATSRASGVAVDSSGNVFVSASTDSESEVNEYDPAGALLSSSGAEQLNAAGFLAIDESGGKLYVVDGEFISGPSQRPPNVKIFGSLTTFPDATTGGVNGVTGQSATLNGLVGADGGPNATCVFQYVDAVAFAESGFNSALSQPCAPAGPFSGESLTPVHADVSNLNGGTLYRYRLFASSINGSTAGAAEAFTTLGPSIDSQSATGISETGATLKAEINPHGKTTTYHFEYVAQEQFEKSKFDAATIVPVPDGPAGSGGGDVEVSQEISGLIPGIQYHFRAVASNELGEGRGGDSRFATYVQAGASLPDRRAYEQASPPEKNGANIQGFTDTVRAAAGGDGITFLTNAGLPGGDGAQTFPNYLALRAGDPAGWSTQGLLPPAPTGPRGKVLGWSDDLRWAFDNNYSPGSKATLFARDTASRTTTEIATGLGGANANAQEPVPTFVGLSSDGTVVGFEDSALLVPGAKAGKSNVYLLDRGTGTLRLASALNNSSSGQAPPAGAFAGAYDWYLGGTGGGSQDFYYTQDDHALSQNGTRLVFTAAGTNQLYVRINALQPQSPLDSKKRCTDTAKACTLQVSASQATTPDPLGERPAMFNHATPDGRFVFFMSSGKLTDDATTGPVGAGRDLYRYEVDTQKLIDVTPDPGSVNGADVQGVLGASDDGSYVYFAANGVIAPGASPGSCLPGKGSCNLYVWHDGAVSFVAPVSLGGGIGVSDEANWQPTSHSVGNIISERSSRVSPDGKVLLFRSVLPLSGYANQKRTEIYRYATAGGPGSLQCISCNPTNASPTGDASLQAIPQPFATPGRQAAILTRNLSAGGNRIFFDSPDPLVAGDSNGVNDVYEWEANGVGTCQSQAQNGGCLYLLSRGTSPRPSYFADADVLGENAFVFTPDALVSQDRDELVDVYDARVDGGILSQNVDKPTVCVGEACKLPPPSPPAGVSPGSASFSGPGNVTRKPCKKGQKRVVKHGKEQCVKVKHRKNKKRGGARSKQHGKGATR